MKECVRVKKILSRYIDKETNYADSALVEMHVYHCPLCKKELSELMRVKELVLKKERKTLSQNYLILRLRRKIAGEQRVTRRFSLAGIGNFSRRLIPVPVAAIALLAAFLLLSSRQQVSKYSLEDNMLSGTPATSEAALRLVLGAQS